MSDRIPPFTALRAFEAAARHMSFAKAADELNVTPAALSFQIKSLEDHLGAPVFKRLNRAVELTEVGTQLAPGTREGLALLSQAWRSALRNVNQTHLTVTAGPSFTSKWLAPRMFDFAQAHPDIELRFAAGLHMMDFDRDDVDVAIRFGYGRDTGVFAKPIMSEFYTPMCVPDLAEHISQPEDILKFPLIYSDDTDFMDPPCSWDQWFKAAGSDATAPAGSHFSQSDHALDAAAAGAGIALGRTALGHKALKEGRLVAPIKIALSTEAHFRFLCPEGSEVRPHIAAFLAWMETQTSETSDMLANFNVIPAGSI